MIKHDKILRDLEQRIKAYDRHTLMWKNQEYVSGDLQGEIDLLTYDTKHGVFHFYEVKSSRNNSSMIKALDQYQRFRKAFPDLNTKGIAIFGEELKPVRLYQ